MEKMLETAIYVGIRVMLEKMLETGVYAGQDMSDRRGFEAYWQDRH
jgi:hypothetical protein